MHPIAATCRWHSRLALLTATILLVSTWTTASAEILKFGFILSAKSQLGQGATVFATEIEKKTGGRTTIELYPDAMLGGEVEMLKSLQLGTIDLAFITGAPLPTIVPEVGVFNIPFLFHDVADARALLDGSLGDEYRAKFDQVGITALAWGENGMREITTTGQPVRRPADLVGLKLRLPQSNVMAAGFKALGADVQQIPFPEVYAALQSGRVDGEENPIATILSSHFAQVQAFLSLTDHIYDPALIVMSKERYDELSSDDKVAFRDAAVVAAKTSRKVSSEAARDGIASLRAAGMSVTTDVDRVALAKAAAAAGPYFEKRFGRDAIEKIRSYRGATTRASEQTSATPQ